MQRHEKRKADELKGGVLIIENEVNSQNKIKNLIEVDSNITTSSKEESYAFLASIKYGIIVIGHCSLTYLQSIKELIQIKAIKIIAIVENELEAISMQKFGIFDLVPASHVDNMLAPAIKRAYYVNSLEEKLNKSTQQHYDDFLITKSASMFPVLQQIKSITDSVLNVLIKGENGTGKALIAHKIHEESQRASKAFIRVNCAYLSAHLLEHELFGNPDDLPQQKTSKIAQADGGTLFLDGINDLSAHLQNKIVEFNKTKKLYHSTKIYDVRIISSVQLESSKKDIDNNLLNEFYELLSEIVILLPSLKERKNDIWLLANVFLKKFNHEYNRNIKGFSNNAQELLLSYDWHGNILQLENFIKSAVILADSNLINLNEIMVKKNEDKRENNILNLKQIREKTERQAINQALTRVRGNISQAATLLGVSRPTLYTLLEKYSLNKLN